MLFEINSFFKIELKNLKVMEIRNFLGGIFVCYDDEIVKSDENNNS